MLRPRQFHLVHGDFQPLSIRRGEPIRAELEYFSNRMPVDLWAISPEGVEFVSDDRSFSVGEQINLTVRLNRKTLEFKNLEIAQSSQEKGRMTYGLKWKAGSHLSSGPERNRRWTIDSSLPVTVECPNPILFDDLLLFRVVNISADRALLHTSMRNKVLIPGVELEGTWSFPSIGTATGAFIVQGVQVISENGIKKLALEVQFTKRHRELNTLTGEYVLQFGQPKSVAEIRDSGLNLRNAKNAIIVNSVESEEDYQEVIELRRRAYQRYSNDDIPEMSDQFDAHSRILTARHRGKIVGTLRLIFHKPGQVTEVGQYLELPEHFPANEECVEASRLAVDPDYQLSSVVLDLQRQMFVVMLQTGRRFMIGATPDHLSENYKRIGAEVIHEIYYSPKSCPDLKLYLMVLDLFHIMANPDRVGPVMWNRMYDKLLGYADRHELIQMGELKKLSRRNYCLMKVVS